MAPSTMGRWAAHRPIGPSAQRLLGRRLVGGAIGVRGAFRNLNYDVFVGAPIRKPEGYRTATATGGINFNYGF